LACFLRRSALVRWRARPLTRAIPHVLLVGVLITSAVIVKEWAYAATFRLLLDARVDDSPSSTATQRFDLEGEHIVPKILMHDDRVLFRSEIGQDSRIRAEVRPAPGAAFEVHLRRRGGDEVIAQAAGLSAPLSLAAPFPSGTGEIQIVSHGETTWADLRVERGMHIVRPTGLLVGLLALSLLWTKLSRPFAPTSVAPRRDRQIWFTALTVCASVLVSLLVLEAGLRAVGSRISPGISALRHDLGEPTEDPRWQQTSRYGQRLRPNIDAPSEWRYGDIIRMGFVPPAAGEGLLHRYPYHADSEGFRNETPRDPISVAALGDSFTDALTVRREDAWPAKLEARIGLPVQNYGTAGFGPQQELLVLKDFALRHHPRVVVLGFFAGNDIHDAEAFENFQRAEMQVDQPQLGWPVKSIFTRADTWFIASALQVGTQVLARAGEPEASSPLGEQAGGESGVPHDSALPSPSFNRGVFTVPVNGRVLRWALMPPYLNLLNFDERALSARRGWTLIQENLVEMQRVSRAAGADFVVALIPFKSQVYLPLLGRSFERSALADALQFYLRDRRGRPDVDRLFRNRLAQNVMMARFCEQAGIPLLDLTPVLQGRVESGEQMYFADDSHLNEAGQAAMASAIAVFLAARGSFHATMAPWR
jgi:lysophospholipase L1-like esterase